MVVVLVGVIAEDRGNGGDCKLGVGIEVVIVLGCSWY